MAPTTVHNCHTVFAGIVAETIASGSYGLIQVYGYHSAVRCHTTTLAANPIAKGSPLINQTAEFCLEGMLLSKSTNTAGAPSYFYNPVGFAFAAQASFTTKAIAAFIKAM